MASYAYTFNSGDGVTPTRLNAARTVSDIVNADIKSDAAIAGSKLASGGVGTAQLADASITAAKLDGAQTGSAPIYGCRAWVNFDGTAGATVDGEFRCTIRASGNIAKVVRTATGKYRVHFTTAMQDANFCAVAGVSQDGAGTYNQPQIEATNVAWVDVWSSPDRSDSFGNSSLVCVSVFR